MNFSMFLFVSFAHSRSVTVPAIWCTIHFLDVHGTRYWHKRTMTGTHVGGLFTFVSARCTDLILNYALDGNNKLF